MGSAAPTDSLRTLRFDNVGSMIRPPALVRLFAERAAGAIDEPQLRAGQEQAIRDLIAEQERRGHPLAVDGEFRRRVFTESFAEVEGLSDWEESYARNSLGIGEREAGTEGRWSATSHQLRVPVTARLRLLRNRPCEHYALAQAQTGLPVKPTLVGVERIFQTLDLEGSRGLYADPYELLDDLVAVQREIVAGLRDAGCRYVHVDSPGFTAYVDRPSLARLRERGFDPMDLMSRAIEAENAVIADFPELTFGIHLCRGNQAGHWHREGPYDEIAEELFERLDHQRLLLEYDTERAGGFAPLRHVPAEKVAVLGLVTTKDARVEEASELLRRIEDASRFIDPRQIAISPQCGFESNVGTAVLGVDEQWAKLEVCLEVGRQVWG
jgi:methionine synthase II (cobalamin-independent)